MKTMTVNKKNLIIELRREKKSYEEIGSIIGITKQRVHQILKEYKTIDKNTIDIVKKRDSNECLICYSKKNIEVHHINGSRKDNHHANLVTLCRKCHIRIEKNNRKTKKGYSEHFRHGEKILKRRKPKVD